MKTSEKVHYIFKKVNWSQFILNKVNWGQFILNGEAIMYMNEVLKEIEELEKNIN